MAHTTIADTRIRMRPSKILLNLIAEHQEKLTELPVNIAKALKSNGYSLSSKVEILDDNLEVNASKINLKLLRELNGNKPIMHKASTRSEEEDQTGQDSGDAPGGGKRNPLDDCLYLKDLRWLNSWLSQLRKEQGIDVYLHNVIEKCELQLPENAVIERNPELEARCQKLREQQQNLEYLNMIKNVDSHLKYVPEDTVAYQMKAINSQIIAVLQFVFSVAAGFAFGFLGIELIVGNLEFGLRLMLGIVCALIIGVAEIYFLTKKLSEYDKAVDSFKDRAKATPSKTSTKSKKPHAE